MRALILSDIHANMQALAAVLAVAPEHDIVGNLGDVVGYGASPNETIVCLRELNSGLCARQPRPRVLRAGRSG